MYGTQTMQTKKNSTEQFENDVKMYGTQTVLNACKTVSPFENDVKMYGTQTVDIAPGIPLSLRMM